MTILAIDQGTTSSRALHLSGDGRLVKSFSVEHRQHYPAPGHVEHDPGELLANVTKCLQSVEDLDAVALANQGESCLAWDARDGRPVGPVIVWQDDRTASVTSRMQRDGLAEEVMQRAGLPLDPYFSASKLGWILNNIPQAATLARSGHLRLGTTDAWFRDRLTGRFETDIATASRTSLMNIETGEWDSELCRMFGVPMDALPPIGPTSGNLGDLPCGARLAASIVDQQAALYGHGCRAPGDAKITFGTGAFAQCVTEGLVRTSRPGPLPTVAWQAEGNPVTYALDGAIYVAASAVNWVRELGLFSSYEEIAAFSGEAAIDRGMVFVPALAGLGCPHWNRKARGSWLGLDLSSSRSDLMQAVLEGIAMRCREVIDAMEAVQPFAGSISIDGGLSNNAYFTAFLASMLGRDMRISKETELTAAGLLMMAFETTGREVPDFGVSDTIGGVGDGRVQDRIAVFDAARRAVEQFAER
jgi:glycerol kinase